MALRDQPYLPLFVQDYLTDEKLNMCSPATQGVYIKIMCILHKQEEYGTLLLKQKDKQKESTSLNFAYKFAKLLPFTVEQIFPAIEELVEEDVLIIEGDKIIQRRMVKDNHISEVRSLAGKKGGENTQFALANAKAKNKANSEYEYEYEYVNENSIKGGVGEEKFNFKNSLIKLGVEEEIVSDWLKVRSKKRATNSSTAFSSIVTQIKLSGLTANDCIKTAVENSWSGFKAEWLYEKDRRNNKRGFASDTTKGAINYVTEGFARQVSQVS